MNTQRYRPGRAVQMPAMLVLTACASSTTVVQPFTATPPASIAVLPLEGGDLPPRGRTIVRHLLGGALQYRHFTTLDDQYVDQQLALAGYQPWRDQWLPGDAELMRIGRQLGVEALLVASGFVDSHFEAGIYHRRGVRGSLRLLEVATGRTIWSAAADASASGGLLTDSGQIVRALSETFQSADVAFVRHASAIALDLMEALPDAAITAPPQRPHVDSVTVKPGPTSGALRPGDLVEIEVTATPRCLATATLGGRLNGCPLAEQEPGVYRGTIRIEPGAGELEGPVTVQLVDAFGSVGEPGRSGTRLAVSAPSLDVPAEVVADLADPDQRRVRLHWRAVPGATGYLVFRAVPSGASCTLPKVAGSEAEDRLPPTAATAAYYVQALGANGAASAKSLPAAVTCPERGTVAAPAAARSGATP